MQLLKTNKNSRKIFGERELKIIEKQLNGINLTQSEKNRLSRDIREKFRFIREVSKFEEEFDLKKSKHVKEKIEQAKEEILHDILKNKIKRILLFGSVVKNEIGVKSDIDIAVEFDKISLKDATKFRIRTLGNLPDKIDIQVYNYLPKKITKEINKKHRILYIK